MEKAGAKRSRPNIVLILADDMGYGDFSRFNGGLSQTPTLDALIDESVCLTQHYTASPVCNPSRAALLTGRYPHRTGSIDTLEWRGLERLALRETTLAEVFQRAGYATGLVGKWHLGAFDSRYHPNARGFDEAVCFRGGMHDYYNWRLEYNEQVVRADGRYLTDLFTEEAVQFITRHQKDPFFLHLAYNAPHTPLQVPEESIRPFQDTSITQAVRTLYGMVARMDAGVARILETLRRSGLEENTLVLFSSDNGPQFSGTGEDSLVRFNCGFNGAKGTVYEGGIKVPAIVRWPEGLPGGSTCDRMVHFTDWFPTLLAASDLEPPEHLALDGLNVLPVLQGDIGTVDTVRFWQWNRYTPVPFCNAAMRDGPWKLAFPAIHEAMQVPDIHWLDVSMYNPEQFIEHGLVTDPEPHRTVPDPHEPELYNLDDDPLERNNLAATQPERVETMTWVLSSWFEEVEQERMTIGEDSY